MIARDTIRVAMRLLCLIALVVCAADAQIADGVTLSITRPANIVPDQAEFSAVFTVALDTTQQQVTQVLQDLGVSNPVVTAVAVASNTYSYPPSEDGSQLYFQVAFTTTPGAMKDISKKLDAFRAALPAGFTSLQFGAALTVSPAGIEAARQTALPLLLSEARTKAQALASAAGIKLGAIVGITEWSYSGYSAIGGIGTSPAIIGTSTYSSSSGPAYSFSATVKFAVQ